MALREGERLVLPADIKDQVPWNEAEAVVILVQMPKGKENSLFMSHLSWNELAFLHAQLGAHLNHYLGPMQEGAP